MKIVISSAWYPVCVAVYLARAARRMGHEVVAVGPRFGKMPWPDANPDRDYSAFAPVVDVPVGELRRPIGSAGAETGTVCSATHPDRVAGAQLWIDVDGGWFMPAELLRMLPVPPAAQRRVRIATDPHIVAQAGAQWGIDAHREEVHRVYSMQAGYLDETKGDRWLPYGWDPEWHRQQEVAQDHDVTLVGASYPERCEIVDRLRECGLRVIGPGRGPIGTDYSRELCRAPIALVWPLSDDLPARVVEALACRRIVVVPHVLGLEIYVGNALFIDSTKPSPAEFADHVLGLAPFLEQLHMRTDDLSELRRLHTWDRRLAKLIFTEFPE